MKGTSGPKGDARERERERGWRAGGGMGEEKGREDKEKGAGGPPY